AELSGATPKHDRERAREYVEGLGREEAEDLDVEADDPVPATTRASEVRSLAQLLITGGTSEEIDVAYLTDSLRSVLDKPRIWGTDARPVDANQIQRLKTA